MGKEQPAIKFSNSYFKLVGIDKDSNILLHVFRINYNNLEKEFIQYDTCYEDKDGKLCFYELPKTELLCLLFFSKTGDLFTTLRRFTPEKETYYKSLIGKWFKVVISESR